MGRTSTTAVRIVRGAARGRRRRRQAARPTRPDTITIDGDAPAFRAGGGSLWEGTTLHDLYRGAYMPWDWQPRLKALATDLGLDCFSSPFDETAVDFLLAMDVPAFKIASFELVDLPLIRRVASTGRPVIMSTGMATEAEVDEAVAAARDGRCDRRSPYSRRRAPIRRSAESMNLRAIPAMAERYGVPIGLSDHSTRRLGGRRPPSRSVHASSRSTSLAHTRIAPPMRRSRLDVAEFGGMVEAIRFTERALGVASLVPTHEEAESLRFRMHRCSSSKTSPKVKF